MKTINEIKNRNNNMSNEEMSKVAKKVMRINNQNEAIGNLIGQIVVDFGAIIVGLGIVALAVYLKSIYFF